MKQNSRLIYIKPEELSWNNYNGLVPVDFLHPAKTVFTFNIIRYTMSKNKTLINWDVAALFNLDESWVNKTILAKYTKEQGVTLFLHELLHYKICILYAKKCKDSLSKSTITSTNQAELIWENFFSQLGKAERDYDIETNGSLIISKQKEWENKINGELFSLRSIKLKDE